MEAANRGPYTGHTGGICAGLIGIKASTEDEGIDVRDLARLSREAAQRNIRFHLKIGGPEARSDIRFGHAIATAIVAPMVESYFALEKFMRAAHGDTDIGVNLETEQAVRRCAEILAYCEPRPDFVVFGRVDLIGSMGIPNVDDRRVEALLVPAIARARELGCKIGLGGAVTTDSWPMFQRLSPDFIETRYLIFNWNAVAAIPNETLTWAHRWEREELGLRKQALQAELQEYEERIGKILSRLNGLSSNTPADGTN